MLRTISEPVLRLHPLVYEPSAGAGGRRRLSWQTPSPYSCPAGDGAGVPERSSEPREVLEGCSIAGIACLRKHMVQTTLCMRQAWKNRDARAHRIVARRTAGAKNNSSPAKAVDSLIHTPQPALEVIHRQGGRVPLTIAHGDSRGAEHLNWMPSTRSRALIQRAKMFADDTNRLNTVSAGRRLAATKRRIHHLNGRRQLNRFQRWQAVGSRRKSRCPTTDHRLCDPQSLAAPEKHARVAHRRHRRRAHSLARTPKHSRATRRHC